MTVATTSSNITYQGNGATTVFTFPFVWAASTDFTVTLTNSTGNETVLNPSQFTLTLTPPATGQLWGVGGSVTYPIAGSPIIAGNYLTITRSNPYTQPTAINNQGAFYPEVVEQALDMLCMLIQQTQTQVDYAIQCPLVDQVAPTLLPPAAERANGYLGFNNFGQPIIVQSAASVTPVSSTAPRIINTTGTATINILTSDSLGGVSIYQSGPAMTTLQLPAGYGPYPVFDGSVNAGTYPITIVPPGGYTILGQSQIILQYSGESYTFYFDGNKYLIG